MRRYEMARGFCHERMARDYSTSKTRSGCRESTTWWPSNVAMPRSARRNSDSPQPQRPAAAPLREQQHRQPAAGRGSHVQDKVGNQCPALAAAHSIAAVSLQCVLDDLWVIAKRSRSWILRRPSPAFAERGDEALFGAISTAVSADVLLTPNARAGLVVGQRTGLTCTFTL